MGVILSYSTIASGSNISHTPLYWDCEIDNLTDSQSTPLIKFLDTYTFCIVVYIEGWSTERETVNFYKRQEIEVGSIWTLEKLRSSI